jgi:dienelactone hydrolase
MTQFHDHSNNSASESSHLGQKTWDDNSKLDRRALLTTAAACGGAALVPTCLKAPETLAQTVSPAKASAGSPTAGGQTDVPSIIGAYGLWASRIIEDPPQLSYRRSSWGNVGTWQKAARDATIDLLAPPNLGNPPLPRSMQRMTHDGLDIEEIQWQMPCGQPTRAVVLKPTGVSGRLPAVLALHDHGGQKYFGLRKIVDVPNLNHSLMVDHRREYYEGRAWANEFARRGYVVLVHDTFAFGSRRVLFNDMREIPWGGASTRGKTDDNAEIAQKIAVYNTWAAEHEHIMAKSLLCAGTTWPGVCLSEDQRALDVLASRDDVDSENIGCAGLSGGGLRTVYLAGLDDRIRCACCIGFMSTWRDFLLNKSYTHTWMSYTPLLPRLLDFPEIMGLRVPLPTMVQNCNEDPLYTLPEMQRADLILSEIFSRAGARDRYKCEFYSGGHKFDIAMQESALTWFDRWLKT